MKQQLFFLLLLSALFGFSQNTANGIDIIDSEQIASFKFSKDQGFISSSRDDNGELVFTVETTEQPKFIYNLAARVPTKHRNYKEGQVFLLSFQAKTLASSLETGEARVLWLFRQSESYKDNLTTTLSISSEWQTYHVPFKATRNISEDAFRLVLQFGFKPQSFQIKGIQFLEMPKNTDVDDLPKTKITYQGMEEGAAWRLAAINRIEKIRKGDVSIQFLNKGKPIQNQAINIKLVRHAFPFGAAATADEINNKPEFYNHFKKTFNHIVLANDLKIKSWRWEPKREATLRALETLSKDGYKTKGHVLIWPGFNYLTPNIKANKDNPEAVRKIMLDHVNAILDATKGKVSHWDVVNEAYTNRDLQKITGSEEILYDGFRILKSKQPKVLAYTNEYGIISKGGIDTEKQQWYYDYIKRVDENTNGLVDGIGIQCHMGSDLTPPQKVLRLLNFYASLGKKISISEFTMDIKDPEVREQYTRDFMIAALSHPSVSEFLFWGYVKDDREKVDIYNEDWSLGAMGKAYFSLVHDIWKTDLNGKTSIEGLVTGRGFYGDYEYSFVHNGELKTGRFELKPNVVNTIKIELNP